MKQITQTSSARDDALLLPAATDSVRILTADEITQIGGGIDVDEYPLPPRG
jgi:hypothetical protein